MHIPYAIFDILLKHLDATVATYKKKTDEILETRSKTLAKTLRNHLKIITNICNIQIKHLQTYI
jgi:hypothetical protein